MTRNTEQTGTGAGCWLTDWSVDGISCTESEISAANRQGGSQLVHLGTEIWSQFNLEGFLTQNPCFENPFLREIVCAIFGELS